MQANDASQPVLEQIERRVLLVDSTTNTTDAAPGSTRAGTATADVTHGAERLGAGEHR